MSSITAIYDGLLTEVKALFPTKKRLQDAINLVDNPDYLLMNGYGITVLEAENPADNFCEITTVRGFGITLTRQCVSTENRTDVFDNTQKELLECLATLNQRLCDGSKLGINEIDVIELQGSSGIEEIRQEKKKFLGITKIILITYSEEIA